MLLRGQTLLSNINVKYNHLQGFVYFHVCVKYIGLCNYKYTLKQALNIYDLLTNMSVI